MPRLGARVLALALGLLLAELLVRLLLPEVGDLHKSDPVTGWSSRHVKMFGADSPRHDVDGRRILFLGDSFLAGSGVGDVDDCFPQLLDDDLGDAVAVRSLATKGWGTDQELLAFRAKGAAWKPDLVVLAFCANNDIANNFSNTHGPNKVKPYFVLGDDGELALYTPFGRETSYEAVTAGVESAFPTVFRSYLVDFVTYLATRRTYSGFAWRDVDPRYTSFDLETERPSEVYEGRDRLSWSPQDRACHLSGYIAGEAPLVADMWRLQEALLARLRDEVEVAGGRLVVMLLPVIFHPADPSTIAGGAYERDFDTPTGPFTFRIREPRDRLAKICDRIGVEFYDPTEEFARRVREENVLTTMWPKAKDRHFSELGHRWLADMFARDFGDRP